MKELSEYKINPLGKFTHDDDYENFCHRICGVAAFVMSEKENEELITRYMKGQLENVESVLIFSVPNNKPLN